MAAVDAGFLHQQKAVGEPRTVHHAPFRLITAVGPQDLASVQQLREVGIRVDVIDSPQTVYFENRYDACLNNRRQRVLSKAVPFTWEVLEPLISDIPDPCFLLGSLLADDFPVDVIRRLHERGRVVVDVQGYLREVRGTEVHAIEWKDSAEAFPYIDILKTNEYEMEVLTSHSDPELAALCLSGSGVDEVLLTLGDRGSIIPSRTLGTVTRIPAYPPKALVDSTGCGDTYTMGYVLRRLQGADIYEAGCFAAAVSTRKLEKTGPFQGNWPQ